MKQHLNTLFITLDGAYLARQGEAVLVRQEKQTKLRVPIHTFGGIVCFGRVGVSPSLMHLCGERGVAISLLSETGRFQARIDGYPSGNVLLRREQYRRSDDNPAATAIARNMIAAKCANARTVLMRNLRDYPQSEGREELDRAVAQTPRVAPSRERGLKLPVMEAIDYACWVAPSRERGLKLVNKDNDHRHLKLRAKLGQNCDNAIAVSR